MQLKKRSEVFLLKTFSESGIVCLRFQAFSEICTLCLCLISHQSGKKDYLAIIFKTVDQFFLSTIFNVFFSVFVFVCVHDFVFVMSPYPSNQLSERSHASTTAQ